MKLILGVLIALAILQDAVSPPVTQKKKEEEDNKIDNEDPDNPNGQMLNLEYNRYLKEVVSALESDPEFKAKLEKAEESDIRSGKIAQELENVNHHVRNKLDELKRQELERLRHLATKEFELRNGIDTEHLKISPEHLDHSNPHTFEIEDLRKLILKTTADLAEADRKRRQEFKEYEMQKEFEKREKLKAMDEEHKKQMMKEMEEKEKKHKEHEPLHHPGSKQQLEEVWEKQDHMENQDFNPRTFFHLHDLDGNGVWDADEVKALFLKELDKMYQAGAPEDDMRERVEEMERMREHVFKEADTNHDGLISYEEFLAQTQKPEFEKDEGWEGLDQQTVYSPEEYQEFERRRQEEIQRMIAQGLIPPYPAGMPPPHPGYQHGVPVQHIPPQQQFPNQAHPGQVPQYQAQHHPHHGSPPQGYVHPPQGQPQPGYHVQVPPQPSNNIAQGQYQPAYNVAQGQHQQASNNIPHIQQSNNIPQASQLQQQQQQQQQPPQQQQQPPPPHHHQQQQQQQQNSAQFAQAPTGQQHQELQGQGAQVKEAQNINLAHVPQHVPQPIDPNHLKEPIDMKQMVQGDSAAAPQAQQVR